MDLNINLDQESREKAAERDLALKLQLEPEFAAAIVLFLKASGKKFFDLYVDYSFYDFYLSKQELVNLLKSHYIKVEHVFSYQLRKHLDDLDYELNSAKRNRIDEQIDAEISTFNNDRSNQSANEIIATTERHFEEYIIAAIAYYASISVNPTREMIAEEALKTLDLEAQARANLISITETQAAAENAKFSEALALSQISPVIFSEGPVEQLQTVKEWLTILDGREREWHGNAYGQQQPINKPFFVGGEWLNYPGDTSLGATAKNTCRCRCSSIYKVKKVIY